MTLKTVRLNSRPSQLTRPGRRHFQTLAVLVTLSLSPPSLLAQEPDILPSDGSRDIQQLEIGNDLFVTLDGVRPSEDYRLTLVDEGQTKIAEAIRQSDASGRVGPGERPLWERTGILGCDPAAPIDPGSFRYQDLDQADAMLGGRELAIEARELGTGQLVASLSIPVTTERTRPVFFFTDAAACPRDKIREGESLYLYARGVHREIREAVVVLIEGGTSPKIGDALVDVRGPGAGPQGIDLEPEQGVFFELVWASAEVGTYGGVVRLNRDLGLIFRGEDRWVGGYGTAIPDPTNLNAIDSGVSPHGITVVPWDCPGCFGSN